MPGRESRKGLIRCGTYARPRHSSNVSSIRRGAFSMTEGSELARAVKAMRPFVPAKDFAASRRFYIDLGFRPEDLGDQLVEMHLGPYSFLLQDYYVEDWAGNFMMHALVTDLDAWWTHISSLDLASRYGVQPPKAPAMQSW